MFVTLTKEEFEEILPEEFEIVDNPMAKEIIYDLNTANPDIAVRIYSSVDERTEKTREIGTDAIRVVFWDRKNGRPVGKGKKILRVEGATTIQERIESRITEFMSGANEQQVIDFDYVRAILEESLWSDFAESLLQNLNDRGFLSDKQLDYIVGELNPKEKPTFEVYVKRNNPDFFEKYLDGLEEAPEVIKEELTVPPLVVKAADGADIELVPTDGYPYKFPYFNPVQSATFPHREKDCNVVVGANTSSGKTIAAELIMKEVFKAGTKVVYMSPLKSLSAERFQDWSSGEAFPGKKVLMLTGDTLTNIKLRAKQMAEANDADIIIMTSELLDSVTRKMQSEKYYWLNQVGLVIVDESHSISLEGRGDVIECALMRFTSLNPGARIVCLSATMPNVMDFESWLTKLNKKPTEVINLSWRPVQLEIHFVEYAITTNQWGREDYWSSQERKRTLAVETAMSKEDEKFLIFVHDKGTGRDLVKRFARVGEVAHFHNADLDVRERAEIEGAFMNREGGLRVMVSTSTTAYGRNMPARNVIIVGVHRGINEVDELDIIQEMGRAGRLGIDPKGDVYLLIPWGSTPIWQEKIRNPRSVRSVINDHHTLAFHVLAEIDNKVVRNAQTLLAWFSRSLAYKQDMDLNIRDAQALLEDLESMEMVTQHFDSYSLTGLGRVGSWLYYSPYDVHAWYKNFGQYLESPGLRDDDKVLAWALTDVPTNNMGYIPKDVQPECSEMQWALRNCKLQSTDAVYYTVAAYACLKGEDEVRSTTKAAMRSIKFDIERVSQAISLIDTNYAKWDCGDLWKIIPPRIMYGISKEMIPLVRIPGIGGKRAKKLWDQGLRTVEDVSDVRNKRGLLKVLQPAMAARVQKAASELITEGEN